MLFLAVCFSSFFGSPPVVNFNDFPVTLKELSESVKPGGWLHTSVMEIGIQAINNSLPATSKKVIMPLRIAVSQIYSFPPPHPSFFPFFISFVTNKEQCMQTRLQQGVHEGAKISKLFRKDNRLDKKDMVSSFSTCFFVQYII